MCNRKKITKFSSLKKKRKEKKREFVIMIPKATLAWHSFKTMIYHE
jgi:hypothetical protein